MSSKEITTEDVRHTYVSSGAIFADDPARNFGYEFDVWLGLRLREAAEMGWDQAVQAMFQSNPVAWENPYRPPVPALGEDEK